ncbi:MAG: acyl-CoA dehydratase activase-related protein [Paludibacteraceae bacterium]|nr:acyl-CoA dehydratase activase-related protein [Paludibacteraceae bacterium]
MSNTVYNIGLDAGSTTLKIVVTDSQGEIIYSDYQRHHADIVRTLSASLCKLKDEKGDFSARMQVTGSAGMGLSERYGIPFTQEVVAATEVIERKFPQVRTLIDIGGEDSKIIFFNKNMQADMRMNGNCAGGTGAFIDQMAAILNVSTSELNDLALNAETIYPIASRCGVFSKTDIQNLVALNVKREDIAISIFNAVATQVLSTLSRGSDILPNVFLCGGPFAFIPALKNIVREKLNLPEDQIILDAHAQVVPAWGASLSAQESTPAKTLSEYISYFESLPNQIERKSSGLQPLFSSEEDYASWLEEKKKNAIKKVELADLKNNVCYIGIDSGSTTTKVVATDEEDNIFFTFYRKSSGRPLEVAQEGLKQLYAEAKAAGRELVVRGSCSIGYGEDLVKTAFGLDYGMVETIAHYTGAHKLNPNVSFILDIGGQDMKAIFVEDGAINRLEINEACSSGCGSFVDSFATSLGCPLDEFVKRACASTNPCDLGTRCTVFMNSKVKQSLREGAPLDDISSGLAYSVVKNCLYKVLKLKSVDELGDNIVLQGGTMRNHAVVRAFELSVGKNVAVSNYPELMGAYGAALYAKRMKENASCGSCADRSLADLCDLKEYTTEPFRCTGCENNCRVLKNVFANGKVFYSGNKCERVYTNKGGETRKAFNMSLFKNESVFKRNIRLEKDAQPFLSIGIPRVLNMNEEFQFWNTLFTKCNIDVKLSQRSTFKMYERGLNTVMADNICFPAKLAHGHIYDLIDKKVDRLFFPYVVYEMQDPNTNNSFNCPVVAGYSDVLRSAINPESKFGIPLDAPVINFKDQDLLKKQCKEYLKSVLKKNYSDKLFNQAFEAAILAQNAYVNLLHEKADHLVKNARKEGRMLILLAGRPYHTDSLVQHKVAEIISQFGVDVVTEDIVRSESAEPLTDVNIIPQWTYINRVVKAAQWVANNNEDNVYFVQLTSFGCGPDAFILDEVSGILHRAHKTHTVLKVDDVNNAGSLKLRIRSLIESLKFKEQERKSPKSFVSTATYMPSDKGKTIYVPYFSDYISPFIEPVFSLMGEKVVSLPPSDQLSAEYGLKYANNEICYPATLVVGDCIKAIKSGNYDLKNIAFAITQTGGQCRATNYIALMKKALVEAGYADIPVVSLSIMNTINEQPGFQPKAKKGAMAAIYAVYFSDAIAKIYYAAAVREKTKGEAKRLRDEFIQRGVQLVWQNKSKKLVDLLAEAAVAFGKITETKDAPKIGVVGEIFIKYNNYGQQHVVEWLVEHGIEPIVPPLSEFFTQYFPNAKFNSKSYLDEKRTWKSKLLQSIGHKFLSGIEKKIDKAAGAFRYYMPLENIDKSAEKASQMVSLAAQFGEGWLIPSEFAFFAEHGIKAAISLQPFGCIANHVISKGIEKRVKDLYPDLNLLFLDFDGGVSEVNVQNRLHFIARQVMK